MIIYSDILSGDELFSDAKRVERNLEECKGVCRIPVKKISESNAIDDSVFGGNASAEGQDAGDGAADGDTVGIDIVLIHKLESLETIFTQDASGKKALKAYFMKFCKAIKKKLEEGGEEGQKKAVEWEKTYAPAIYKYLVKNYSEIAIYGGVNFDGGAPEEHSICFLTYDSCTGLENYMYFIEHSLTEEKV